MKQLLVPLLIAACALACGFAAAKLPALDDAAKAKAAETAAKAGWQAKVDAFLLCKTQDKVAAPVRKAQGLPPLPTACVNPGPFVYTPPAAAAAAAAAPAAAKPAAAPAAPAASAKKA